MPWSPLLAAAAPPDSPAAGSIAGYLLGYGPVGIFLVIMAWLFFKGWRLIPPSREAEIRAGARTEGRADLIEERGRVLAEKIKAEDQRDEALRIAQTEVVPLLVQFTATSGALLPLLQELVSHREGRERDTGRR